MDQKIRTLTTCDDFSSIPGFGDATTSALRGWIYAALCSPVSRASYGATDAITAAAVKEATK